MNFKFHPFLNLWFYNKFYIYFQHFLGIKQIAFAHICVILMIVCCFMVFFILRKLQAVKHRMKRRSCL